MKQRLRHFIYFILLVGLDQGSKIWIKANIEFNNPISIIPNTLVLQYHENTGAVWGILGGQVILLSILSTIILAGLCYVYLKIPKDKKFNALKIITVFLTAGAVGNLIDRIFRRYVVDFIYFELINFPIFNIADSYITVSAILLFVLSIFYYKNEDFEFIDQLFTFKKKNKNDIENNSSDH